MNQSDIFLNRVTLRHLRLLDVVGSELNISRAALRLNMSQPAVSQALRDLEQLLSVRLFNRSTRRLVLTAQGSLLWDHARRILLEVNHAALSFEATRDGHIAELRIGVIAQVDIDIISSTVALMAKSGYKIQLSIEEGVAPELMRKLAAGHLDIVISHLTTGVITTPLTINTLYEETTCLVAAPGHRLSFEADLTWEKVRSQRWILPSREIPVRARIEREMLIRSVPDLADVIESNSPQIVLAVLHKTDAIAVMNNRIAKRYVSQGLLSILPLDFQVGIARYAILRKKEPSPSNAVSMFWQLAITAAEAYK